MSTLVLDSLEIKNFRAFKHLRIEKLGRVNLIVGKNNVGKTTVLEALWLYAEQGDAYRIFALMRERYETVETQVVHSRWGQKETQEIGMTLRHLFHGRGNPQTNLDAIEIGPVYLSSSKLSIKVVWPDPLETPIRSAAANGHGILTATDLRQFNNVTDLTPQLQIGISGSTFFNFPLNQNYFAPLLSQQTLQSIISIFVAANGLSLSDVETLWDNIALSPLEQDVLTSLRIIAPEIQALSLVREGASISNRIPQVRIASVDERISLGSMGEGMNRMLGIALALVNAKDGMLLIDEVDTGLHYSVLLDMWKLIFEVAHRLNVQVFATSHSWDCIQAFQQAADANTDEEGMLIRLEQRKDGIGAVTFDEEELNVVAREQIEVR